MELSNLIKRMSELSNYISPHPPPRQDSIQFRRLKKEIRNLSIADEALDIHVSDEKNQLNFAESLPFYEHDPLIDSKKAEYVEKSLQEVVSKVIQAHLPEPHFSDALYRSGLNSNLIHNPGFSIETEKYDFDSFHAEEAQRIRLVEAFDILSYLEQTLRNFIQSKLKFIHGNSWWDKGIPEDVKNGCIERKMKEEINLNMGISHHFINYAYIHDYRKIITINDNWRQTFYPIFSNKSELETCFTWVGNVRNSIAHARPVSDDGYLMFIAGAKWIQLRILKKTTEIQKRGKKIWGFRNIFGNNTMPE